MHRRSRLRQGDQQEVWFAAHIIIWTKTKKSQSRCRFNENVVLIKAPNEEVALKKATKIGKMYEQTKGGLTLGGQPAKDTFVGIRKLISVGSSSDGRIDNKPADGVEITYSDMEIDSPEGLRRLAKGKPVKVFYLE